MLTKFIEAKISAEERVIGENLDYLKYILRASRPAFFRYLKILPVANFRRTLPVDAYHAAAIIASQHEGCGSCVQIEVNRAIAAGVLPDVVRTVLDGRVDELDQQTRDACRFTVSVLRNDYEQPGFRRAVVRAFGDAGLVELVMKISVSRFFPQTTKALGFSSHLCEQDAPF